MLAYLGTYVVAGVTLVALDLLWLGVIMRSFYVSHYGDLMRASADLRFAALFYLLYTASVIFFAVLPGVERQSLVTALSHGALLGATAYMTYNLTNAAIIRGYPSSAIIPDILWGAFVTAVVAGAGFFVWQWVAS